MAALFLIFFFSGAASLTYEVIWMRQLTLIFGVTTFAVCTILAVFMGGLALGSYLFGRWSDRFGRPLLAYAMVEVGIGLYAFLVPDLFDALRTPYVVLYRLELSRGLLTVCRGVLAAMVLLPPTLLMGGTLPILAKALIQRRPNVGRQVALLYFVNTGGAVAGCALAGFYLIENLGIIGTTRVGCTLNMLLALATVALQLGVGRRWTVPRRTTASESGPIISSAMIPLVLACIGISGFTSLAYESFWARALLRYLNNSTYAFTTMLAVFLAGIAIGSWVYLVLPYRRTRPLLVFGVLEFGVALGFALSAGLFENLVQFSSLVIDTEVHSFGDTLQTLVLRSAMILFLPALFLGATLPVATDACAHQLEAAGGTVGKVYAVNTIGAILGTLVLTFVLVPTLGMQGSLMLLLMINSAVAGLLLIAGLDGARGRLAAGAAVAMGCGLVVTALPSDIFRRTFAEPGSEIIFYDEGATDTVGVVEQPDRQRRIVYQDRRGTAGTMTYPMNYLFGHLPLLLHPGEPATALHICFGVGNSLSAMARNGALVHIDSVELSPHVLAAARYFWTNDDVESDPRIRTVIDDGRNYVMATDQIYDVIELEPPETFTTGVINLYSREFYADVRDRLSEDGVFLQWVPVGEAPLGEERMLFRAFYEVFPLATVWQQLDNGPILLVGTKLPLEIDYRRLEEQMQQPLVRRDLATADIHNAEDLLSLFVFGPETLARLVENVAPVTDDLTVLDFSMPRYLGSGFGTGVLSAVASAGGKNAWSMRVKHVEYYRGMRSSVLAHVKNASSIERAAIERRILDRPLPAGWRDRKPMSKAEWMRWAGRSEQG